MNPQKEIAQKELPRSKIYAVQFLKRQYELKVWIEKVNEEKISGRDKSGKWNLQKYLKNGVSLCKLMEKIEEGSIPSVYMTPDAPFQSKSNIFYFLSAAEQLGIQRHRLFKVSDLVDLNRKGFLRVVECIEEVSLFCETPITNVPDSELPKWKEDEIADAEKQILHVKNFVPRNLHRIKRSSSEVRKNLFMTSPPSLIARIENVIKGKEEKVAKGIILLQAAVRARIARRKLQTRITQNAKRKAIVKELVNTEKTYLNGLKILIKEFHHNLTEPTLKESLLKPEQVKKLFPSSLFSIIELNSKLSTHLEDRLKNWSHYQKIGDLLLSISGFVEAYTEYVKDYEAAIAIFQENRTKTKFAQFLWDCRQKEEVGGRDLDSFLILPVQRIPRYNLLLTELIKHTWTDHMDYDNLKKSLEKIQQVASYMNERKREAETLSKMIEIQNRVTGDLEDFMNVSRMFIREDNFKILVEGRQLERVFFLFNDSLLVAKPSLISTKKQMKVELFRNLAKIEIHETQPDQIASDPENYPANSVKIKDNYDKDIMTVVFPDEFERANWLEQFDNAKDQVDKEYEKDHVKAIHRSEKKAQEAKEALAAQYKKMKDGGSLNRSSGRFIRTKLENPDQNRRRAATLLVRPSETTPKLSSKNKKDKRDEKKEEKKEKKEEQKEEQKEKKEDKGKTSEIPLKSNTGSNRGSTNEEASEVSDNEEKKKWFSQLKQKMKKKKEEKEEMIKENSKYGSKKEEKSDLFKNRTAVF